jgi:hypothetical protein
MPCRRVHRLEWPVQLSAVICTSGTPLEPNKPPICAALIIGVSATLFLLLRQRSVPHQGGRKIKRIDVDDLEYACNSRAPANPNPC